MTIGWLPTFVQRRIRSSDTEVRTTTNQKDREKATFSGESPQHSPKKITSFASNEKGREDVQVRVGSDSVVTAENPMYYNSKVQDIPE